VFNDGGSRDDLDVDQVAIIVDVLPRNVIFIWFSIA
jgi:hypothetical protein